MAIPFGHVVVPTILVQTVPSGHHYRRGFGVNLGTSAFKGRRIGRQLSICGIHSGHSYLLRFSVSRDRPTRFPMAPKKREGDYRIGRID